MAESTTFSLNFQPFTMPSGLNFLRHLIERNLKNILSGKKYRKKSTSLGEKVEKLQNSLFDPPKKNFLEIFFNFFFMKIRFQGMLFNLVASRSKSPSVIKISKNPLRTLVIKSMFHKYLSSFHWPCHEIDTFCTSILCF